MADETLIKKIEVTLFMHDKPFTKVVFAIRIDTCREKRLLKDGTYVKYVT